MQTQLWVLIALIALLGIWVYFQSRRKTWYKVTLANNEERLLYRDLQVRFWRASDKYVRFKNEQGLEVTFPSQGHWVLQWEEVPLAKLNEVRESMRKRAQELAGAQQ